MQTANLALKKHELLLKNLGLQTPYTHCLCAHPVLRLKTVNHKLLLPLLQHVFMAVRYEGPNLELTELIPSRGDKEPINVYNTVYN